MVSRNRLLLLLILCLFGFGLWFLQSPPNSNEPHPKQEVTSPKDAASKPTQADKMAEESSDLERDDLVAKNDIDLIPENERLQVQVLHAVTKELMKNVTVHWQVVEPGSQTKPEDFDRLLMASKDFQSTGKDGAIWIKRPEKRNIEFQVNTGELYGRGYYWARIAPDIATVYVFPDQTLRVHVQHHDGSHAQNIRVSFAGKNRRTGKSTEFHFAKTNQEGIALLSHMQLFRPHPRSSQGKDSLFVVAGIASVNPPMRRFSVGEEMPHEIELKLPPLGIAQVRALQETGSSFPDGWRVSLQGSRPGHPGTESLNHVFLRPEPIRGWNQEPLVQGVATFPVALQEHLEFAIHLPDHHKLPWDSGLGPTLEGETKVFTLQLQEAPCYLNFRLIDRNGNPLARQQVVANLLTSGRQGRFRGTTDAEGVLRVPVDDRIAASSDDDRQGLAPRALAVFGDLEHGVRITGVHLLDKDLDPGNNLGGDLVLGAALLAQGQVVDQQGQGLRGAQVRILAEPNFQGAPHRNLDGGETFWTNTKGQFQLWGNSGSGAIRVQVTRQPFLPTDSVFLAGNAEITVVMKPSAQQQLQVQLPTGAHSNLLRLEFQSTGSGPTWLLPDIPVDGSPLDLGAYPEGVYTLRIRLRGVNAPILSVENVDLTSGAAQDPRLLPLDLRPYLNMGEVQVFGIHGEPLKEFHYRFAGNDGGLVGQSGVPFPFAKSSNQVQIWATDSRASVVTLSRTTQEVHLQPAFPLQLQATALPVLPENATYSLLLSSPENQFLQIIPWDPQQLKSIHLPHAGLYHLQVFTQYRLVDQPKTKREDYLLLDGQDELDFEIPDSGGVHTVNVRVSKKP